MRMIESSRGAFVPLNPPAQSFLAEDFTEIDAVRSNITEEDARELARKLPDASIRYAIDGNPHKNEKIMPRTTPSP